MTAGLLPFGRQTVGSLLATRAAATPHAPFLAFDDGESTTELDYAAAARLAERGAAVLAGAGVGRGDRVALVLDNRPEFLACWFGAALIGAIVVPANPQTSVAELRHIVGHARCRVVVCPPRGRAGRVRRRGARRPLAGGAAAVPRQRAVLLRHVGAGHRRPREPTPGGGAVLRRVKTQGRARVRG
ncbi:AMP-binding protein [Nonomuraea africana]|uniref:AMP-binding protein n=1 Tax=Nonomuraea africana TaxID=46171 RepID=UPI0033C19CCB